MTNFIGKISISMVRQLIRQSLIDQRNEMSENELLSCNSHNGGLGEAKITQISKDEWGVTFAVDLWLSRGCNKDTMKFSTFKSAEDYLLKKKIRIKATNLDLDT